MQCDAGWRRDFGVVDHGVASECGNLKTELTRAQHSVQTTVEKVFDLRR